MSLPILAVAGIGIKFNAELEVMAAGFEVLTGSGERAMELMKELKAFSASTPLQIGGLANAATNLMAFGTASEDVIEQIRMLGDAAQGQQGKLDSLVRAYGRIQAKGKTSLEELNIFLEAGVPILAVLAEQFGVAQEAIFDMASAGDIAFADVEMALKSLTSEGGQFNGMMARMSETTSGKFSTALDNAKLALAGLTESLMPFINIALDGFTDAAKAVTELDDGTKRLILGVGGLLVAIGPVSSIFSLLLRNSKGLTAPFRILRESMFGVGKASNSVVNALRGVRTGQTQMGQSLSSTSRLWNSQSLLMKGWARTAGAASGVVAKLAGALGVSALAAGGLIVAALAAAAAVAVLTVRWVKHRKQFEENANRMKENAEVFRSTMISMNEIREASDNYYVARAEGARQSLEFADDELLDLKTRRAELIRIQEKQGELNEDQIKELGIIEERIDNREVERGSIQLVINRLEAQGSAENSLLQAQLERLRNLKATRLVEREILIGSLYDVESLKEGLVELTAQGYRRRFFTEEEIAGFELTNAALNDEIDKYEEVLDLLDARISATNQQLQLEQEITSNQSQQTAFAIARDLLQEKYDASLEGQIILLQAQFRYFESMSSVNETIMHQREVVLGMIEDEIEALKERQRVEGLSSTQLLEESIRGNVIDQMQEINDLHIIRAGLIGQQNLEIFGGVALTDQELIINSLIVEEIDKRLKLLIEQEEIQDENNDALDEYRRILEGIIEDIPSGLDNLRNRLEEISNTSLTLNADDLTLQQDAVEEMKTQIQEEIDSIMSDISVDFNLIEETRGAEGFNALWDAYGAVIDNFATEYLDFQEKIASGSEITAREIESMIEKSKGVQDIVDEFEILKVETDDILSEIEKLMADFNIDEILAGLLEGLDEEVVNAYLSLVPKLQELLSPEMFVEWAEVLDIAEQDFADFANSVYASLQGLLLSALTSANEALEEFGEALRNNEDAANAAGEGLRNLAASIVDQLPQLLLSAGLQLIAAGNWQVGLALVAASGLISLVSGISESSAEQLARISADEQEFLASLGAFEALNDQLESLEEELADRRIDILIDAKNQELDILREINDARLDALYDELDELRKQARDKIEIIEAGYNEELYLLRQQLERNLISQEEYQQRVEDMLAEKIGDISAIETGVSGAEEGVSAEEDRLAAEERAKQAEIDRLNQIRDISGDIGGIAGTVAATAGALEAFVGSTSFGGDVGDQLAAFQEQASTAANQIAALQEQAGGASTVEEAQALLEQAEALRGTVISASSGARDLANPAINLLRDIMSARTQIAEYDDTLHWFFNNTEKYDVSQALNQLDTWLSEISAGNWDTARLAEIGSNLPSVYDHLRLEPGFAAGGAFRATSPSLFLAGESGPEDVFITPRSPGVISPFNGGGAPSYSFTINGDVYGMDAEDVATKIVSKAKEAVSRGRF